MSKAISRKDFYAAVAIIVCVVVSIEVSLHAQLNIFSQDYSVATTTVVNDEHYRALNVDNSSGRGDYDKLLAEFRNMIPIGIPPGKAVALPSIRVEENAENTVDSKRHIYGGKGDKKHLGGFTELDLEGVSPSVWKYMIQGLGIHSVLDVGCGRGTSTSWFLLHGVDVLCAEGSHDAVERSFLPDVANQVVEHDFSRGPWWPEKTYDAVWSIEFLEHVGVNYHYNYISSFRKAALIFVTSSVWGGWHHVEVHNDTWWIRKYESYGFRYDAKLSETIRSIAGEESEGKLPDTIAPNGKPYVGQHIIRNMKVFINPMVAALPVHAHLFASHGCFHYYGADFKDPINRPCGEGSEGEIESVLPKEFLPLELKPEMDEEWNQLIQKNIQADKTP